MSRHRLGSTHTMRELMGEETSEDKTTKLIVAVRKKLRQQGATSREGFERAFDRFDCVVVDGKIDLREFITTLPAIGVNVEAMGEVTHLLSTIDTDHSGTVEFDEFLRAFEMPLNKFRTQLSLKIFKRFDPVDNLAPIQRVMDHCLLEYHPAARTAKTVDALKEAKIVLAEKARAELCDAEGQVSRESWLLYCKGIGAAMEKDDEFGVTMSHMFDFPFIPTASFKKAMKMIRRAVLQDPKTDSNQTSEAPNEATDATKAKKEQAKLISRVFKKYDTNSDRVIDMREFTKMLRGVGVELDRHEIAALFNHFDHDENHAIELDEFIKAITSASE